LSLINGDLTCRANVYVNASVVEKAGLKQLHFGTKVTFDLVLNHHGKLVADSLRASYTNLEPLRSAHRVSYAVLSFGGFLGIDDDHYPLPWQSLKYDTNLGGYRTGLTETQLKGAPKYGNDNTWNWVDPATARTVNDYYGVAIAVRRAFFWANARL
jgi:cold shock CspA family protein